MNRVNIIIVEDLILVRRNVSFVLESVQSAYLKNMKFMYVK